MSKRLSTYTKELELYIDWQEQEKRVLSEKIERITNKSDWYKEVEELRKQNADAIRLLQIVFNHGVQHLRPKVRKELEGLLKSAQSLTMYRYDKDTSDNFSGKFYSVHCDDADIIRCDTIDLRDLLQATQDKQSADVRHIRLHTILCYSTHGWIHGL